MTALLSRLNRVAPATFNVIRKVSPSSLEGYQLFRTNLNISTVTKGAQHSA